MSQSHFICHVTRGRGSAEGGVEKRFTLSCRTRDNLHQIDSVILGYQKLFRLDSEVDTLHMAPHSTPRVVLSEAAPRWRSNLVVRIGFPSNSPVVLPDVLVLHLGAGWKVDSNYGYV